MRDHMKSCGCVQVDDPEVDRFDSYSIMGFGWLTSIMDMPLLCCWLNRGFSAFGEALVAYDWPLRTSISYTTVSTMYYPCLVAITNHHYPPLVAITIPILIRGTPSSSWSPPVELVLVDGFLGWSFIKTVGHWKSYRSGTRIFQEYSDIGHHYCWLLSRHITAINRYVLYNCWRFSPVTVGYETGY